MMENLEKAVTLTLEELNQLSRKNYRRGFFAGVVVCVLARAVINGDIHLTRTNHS